MVCLIATDFAKGGAVDRRELFAQDRMRKGIAGCLAALDAAGVQSVVLPLLGAASSGTQTDDARFEGQRVLKECRLINSTAGIVLGIHDFAAYPPQSPRDRHRPVGSGSHRDVQRAERHSRRRERSKGVSRVRRTDSTGFPQRAGRREDDRERRRRQLQRDLQRSVSPKNDLNPHFPVSRHRDGRFSTTDRVGSCAEHVCARH